MNDLRNLPKIDEFLSDARLLERAGIPAQRVTGIIRESVQKTRAAMLKGEISGARDELFEIIMRDILAGLDEYTAERLKPVINATGVIIHTNLGRAVLSRTVAERAIELAAGYSNLELSTTTGKRRNRLCYIERLLCDLTGAEAALVVNNNAAAVFLSLNTICSGKEVLLSRGEIVEIGDSFRISDIIALSGCKIKEVGTTNRTCLSDYELNISPETGVIAKIHTSNYKIIGFTASAPPSELAALAAANGLVSLEDMGSGVMVNMQNYGLPAERTVADALSDGMDIVTISGDKLLGGPQAGIILGKSEYISRMKKNQLLRCLRIDKLRLAVLESTLTEYSTKAPGIPALECIRQKPDVLKARAESLKALLDQTSSDFTFTVEPHTAQVGGGAMPSQAISSWGVIAKGRNACSTDSVCDSTLECKKRVEKDRRYSDNELESFLRNASTPIITTLQPDGVMVDVIAIPDDSLIEIAAAFASLPK